MKDCIGQELEVDNFVAGMFSSNTTPGIFKIVSFTKLKVRMSPVEDLETIILKFPKDILRLDPAGVNSLINVVPVDHLGQELAVGDYVYNSNGEYIDPVIFEVKELILHKVKLEKVYGEKWVGDPTRHASDLIKVDPRMVTMHLLKKRYND